MEELNSTGLHQFISLFLTLSCVADLEDVVRCLSSLHDGRAENFDTSDSKVS